MTSQSPSSSTSKFMWLSGSLLMRICGTAGAMELGISATGSDFQGAAHHQQQVAAVLIGGHGGVELVRKTLPEGKRCPAS